MNKGGALIGSEVSNKIRDAIKTKLGELGPYVDEELPDYIMIMVANRKTKEQMNGDLGLFLGANTVTFTDWLQDLLSKLESLTAASAAPKTVAPTIPEKVEKQAAVVPPKKKIVTEAAAELPIGTTTVLESINTGVPTAATLAKPAPLVKAPAVAAKPAAPKPLTTVVHVNETVASTTAKSQEKSSSTAVVPYTTTSHRKTREKVIELTELEVGSDLEVVAEERDEFADEAKRRRREERKAAGSASTGKAHKRRSEDDGERAERKKKRKHREDRDRTKEKSVFVRAMADATSKQRTHVSSVVLRPEEGYDPTNPAVNATQIRSTNSLLLRAVKEATSSVTKSMPVSRSEEPSVAPAPPVETVEIEDEVIEVLEEKPKVFDTIQTKRAVVGPSPGPQFTVTMDGLKKEDIVRYERGEEAMETDFLLEEGAEPMEIDLGAAGSGGAHAKTAERCIYWPLCRFGEVCTYHHPTVNCMRFPNCTFGNKCLFIHPECKFDGSCTNRQCAYTHTKSRRGPVGVVRPQQRSASLGVCKFHPECRNSSCAFAHPRPCHFGAECRNLTNCTFWHTTATSNSATKWVAPKMEAAAIKSDIVEIFDAEDKGTSCDFDVHAEDYVAGLAEDGDPPVESTSAESADDVTVTVGSEEDSAAAKKDAAVNDGATEDVTTATEPVAVAEASVVASV